MQANYTNTLCHLNATPLSVAVLVGEADKAKMGQCLGGGLLSLSLSLSLSLVSQLFICNLFFQFFKSFCSSCHFERSEKSKEFKIRFIYGYFACAQYDKFGLLSKNDRQRKRTLSFGNDKQKPQFHTPKALFRSNFRGKIHKFYSFFWIATLALLARNDGKAQIQIFYSKFKAFHKFNSFCKFKAFYKFNSFHNFISNFKPYTRLFHIFTPSFCSVQTDKFQHKEKKWQMKTPSLIILSI